MEISIEYCGTCNYRPIAASLAREIEKAIGVKPALVHSKVMGALEVKVEGKSMLPAGTSGLVAVFRLRQILPPLQKKRNSHDTPAPVSPAEKWEGELHFHFPVYGANRSVPALFLLQLHRLIVT